MPAYNFPRAVAWLPVRKSRGSFRGTRSRRYRNSGTREEARSYAFCAPAAFMLTTFALARKTSSREARIIAKSNRRMPKEAPTASMFTTREILLSWSIWNSSAICSRRSLKGIGTRATPRCFEAASMSSSVSPTPWEIR